MHMKVSIFNEQSTNLLKNDAKRIVKTQGSGKIMKNHKFQNLVFYQLVREPMLNSLAKYDK